MDETRLDDGHGEQRTGFAAVLQELLWAEVKRREGIAEGEPPHGVDGLGPGSPAARRLHLRHLEVAAECGEVAQRVMGEAAVRAGRAGASFPEMGEAACITRQSARQRWPQAVGTRWYLHTLTGRRHPHGVEQSMLRSRDKAVSTGWAAVRKGEAGTGGTVAAVVCDSERRVVWSCLFDPVQYDAVATELPGDLASVPEGGDDHARWVSRWGLFVDTELERRTARS
ncbi:hypothetical protein ABZV68_32300 [Streptomyces clavifer]|uniref:hypothetical protein n=1 Tax=Streptomyces clavifer TaxID=68188 RepID=UPI0033ADF1AD